MPQITKLTSNDNPRVKRVVGLREQKERRAQGVFIAEGVREVERAIEAGLVVRELFACPAQAGMNLQELSARFKTPPDCRWYETSAGVMEKMSYKDRPEGVLAIVDQPQWKWEDAIPRSGNAFLLVAVGITKPGNLGAMARSAAGAGADAMIIADGVVDSFNPNAIRASTGAVFTLPVLAGNSEQVLDFLREKGVTPIVASPDAKADYSRTDLRQPIAIVIGAEDTGLDERWIKAGTAVSIPMPGERVDSLNASIAAGILLFEVVRQRGSSNDSSL